MLVYRNNLNGWTVYAFYNYYAVYDKNEDIRGNKAFGGGLGSSDRAFRFCRAYVDRKAGACNWEPPLRS